MRASKITAIDFFDDLTSPYARKRFLWGFLLLCAICAVLIYLASQFIPKGTFRDVLDAIFIEILAGSLIILAFYCLLIYFIGVNPSLREVSVTRPQDIGERMKSLPLDVSHYMFWGRSGSFFRAYPLLELDRQAREQKKNIDIEIMLPHPTDPRLVASYQDIVHALGETPNKNTLLANVLATSMACASISANNKFIKVKIFFSQFLPAFRVDISDNGAILTQDDPHKSALFFEFESEFYEMFRTTVRNEMSVSEEVKWDEALFKGHVLDAKSCDKDTLNAFGIDVEDLDQIQQDVATLITQRLHRYK